MELHNLKPAKGSVRARKRKARGQGSGTGGTATRGHKGQKSRSGYSKKRAFEGGQMPLQMRLPKRGFKNINRVEYVPLNLGRVQAIVEKYGLDAIDMETLISKGIVRKKDRVKLLAQGTLKKGLTIRVHACSAKAKEAVEAAGGKVELIS